MILSNDTIMNPSYDITPPILKRIASISEKLGELNAYHSDRPSPQLRKQNRIRTIYSSLKIEGNTLTEEQITAILEDKLVIGPQKDIIEVNNAIQVYNDLSDFTFNSEKSFLKAHAVLLKNLVSDAGKYRKQGVGIVKGEKVEHIAPSYDRVPFLMKDLFQYLKKSDDPVLIKSCVFHYELEFIHPFLDGNGRMGRLWQTLTLMNEYPLFEFLPFETLINKYQEDYYKSISISDKEGKSTQFIAFMLNIIDESLSELIDRQKPPVSDIERLTYFIEMQNGSFSRKDYLTVFKNISTATASRDLLKGIELGLIQKRGDKNTSVYEKV